MATSVPTRLARTIATGDLVVAFTAYALGALLLAGEAAVHIQQYYGGFIHDVPKIGPLFLANAASCVVVIAGLAYPRTRQLAAFAGIVISALALGSLVVSYGQGLFGFQEVGFRTGVALAALTEVGAVIMLSAALAASNALVRQR